jgi:hypothetical protein
MLGETILSLRRLLTDLYFFVLRTTFVIVTCVICTMQFWVWPHYLYSQTIDPLRTTIWEEAGLRSPIITSEIVNILDFSADPTGNSDSGPAIQNAINSLNTLGGGLCYIPAGTYLINQSISLPSNISIQGEGTDLTIINFDLGGSGHGFSAIGTLTGTHDTLLLEELKGDQVISVQNASSYQQGDIIRMLPDDGNLIFSTWALNSTGQIAIVQDVNGDELTLHQPLRMDYPLSMKTVIRKVIPKENISISCLKINRLDETTGQTINIFLSYTYNCQVNKIESNLTNYAHISVRYSLHNWISGSYFHHGHNYGSGGKAYGVAIELGSCMNLIDNNVFDNLRHSMLIQAGANANVFSYNYSDNPKRTEFPSSYSGDLVFHGNYPYLNLSEGNTVQNLAIDNSHGLNGPYNTIFRTRVELSGLIMTSASNSQNFVGDEISGTFYLLSGSDHFEHQVNHNGTWHPSNSGTLDENSLYLASAPVFAPTWPCIGYPVAFNSCVSSAQERFESGDVVIQCETILPVEPLSFDVKSAHVFPNPSLETLTLISSDKKGDVSLQILDIHCHQHLLQSFRSGEWKSKISLDIGHLSEGIYFIQITEYNRTESVRFIKVD